MALSCFLIGSEVIYRPVKISCSSSSSPSSPLAAVQCRPAFVATLSRPLDSQLIFRRTRPRTSVISRAEEKANDSSSPTKDREHYEELLDSSGKCDSLCSVDETSLDDVETNCKPKTDLLKALAVVASTLAGTAAINQSWAGANQDLAMALVFVIGYAGIVFEESLAFNKSAVGLLMAVCLWVIRSIGAPSTDIAVTELTRASAEVSEIVFFLLGAMTIVEIVDAHQGFKLVTDNITTRNPRTLLWWSPIKRGRGRPRRTLGELIEQDLLVNNIPKGLITNRAE